MKLTEKFISIPHELALIISIEACALIWLLFFIKRKFDSSNIIVNKKRIMKGKIPGVIDRDVESDDDYDDDIDDELAEDPTKIFV